MKVPAFLLVLALSGLPAVLAKEPKTTPTPEARIEKALDRIIIPKLAFREATLREALDFLKKKSVALEEPLRDQRQSDTGGLKIDPSPPLPPPPRISSDDLFVDRVGARVTVSAVNISLREALRYITDGANTKFQIRADGVHLVSPQLDYLEILKTTGPADALPVPGPEVPKAIEFHHFISDEKPGKDAATLEKKMRRIILPKVALDNLGIDDAVFMLSGMINYNGRSHLTGPGLPFVLENFVDGPADPSAPGISYSAKKVSLYDAVKAIAGLAQCRVHLDGDVVVFERPLPADTLIMRTYLVPPGTDATLEPLSLPPSVDLEKATEWLDSRGANSNLAPGSIYVASKRCLSVRDTEAKQQIVREKIETAWREYYASAKANKQSPH